MSNVACCKVFNFWRFERLAEEYPKNCSLLAFNYEREKLSILLKSNVKLSQKDQKIAELSQKPRELLLTPKELAKLNDRGDQEAIKALFKLTADEEDLICKYFFPASQTLRANHKLPESLKPLKRSIGDSSHSFTHG